MFGADDKGIKDYRIFFTNFHCFHYILDKCDHGMEHWFCVLVLVRCSKWTSIAGSIFHFTEEERKDEHEEEKHCDILEEKEIYDVEEVKEQEA